MASAPRSDSHPLLVVFRPRRGEKQPTKKIKYHAAAGESSFLRKSNLNVGSFFAQPGEKEPT
jgi:hypothetical protein